MPAPGSADVVSDTVERALPDRPVRPGLRRNGVRCAVGARPRTRTASGGLSPDGARRRRGPRAPSSVQLPARRGGLRWVRSNFRPRRCSAAAGIRFRVPKDRRGLKDRRGASTAAGTDADARTCAGTNSDAGSRSWRRSRRRSVDQEVRVAQRRSSCSQEAEVRIRCRHRRSTASRPAPSSPARSVSRRLVGIVASRRRVGRRRQTRYERGRARRSTSRGSAPKKRTTKEAPKKGKKRR